LHTIFLPAVSSFGKVLFNRTLKSSYYYSLEWTLLVKSLVLLASGVTLLALRYFVMRFTWKAGGEA